VQSVASPGSSGPRRISLPNVSTRPAALSAAAAIEAAQGAAVLAAGCYVGVKAIAGHPHDLASAITLGLMVLLGGAGIIAVGWGLWRVRRWGRAPALLTQVFAVIVAVSFIQSHRQLLGALLALAALAAAIALLSPPTTRALVDD
jgi:hypothetical protein